MAVIRIEQRHKGHGSGVDGERLAFVLGSWDTELMFHSVVINMFDN